MHRKATQLKDNELSAENKRLWNKVTHEIKRQETLYYQNEIQWNAGNKNGMWKNVRRVLNKKHTNNNGMPQDLSPDAFKDFFAHVGSQLSGNFQNDTPFLDNAWMYSSIQIQWRPAQICSFKLLLPLPLKTDLGCITYGCQAPCLWVPM